MDWNGQESRKKKRFGVRGSTVKYKRKSVFSMLRAPSARFLVLNMSDGGLHFVTREPLMPGQVLSLDICAPDTDGQINAQGRVIWVRKSQDVEAYHIGVEFTKMSDKNTSLLRHVLDGALLEKVDMSTKVYLKEIEKL
ncbi:MAG: PilZ domain-containing protein [Planctomycetota bacterium]|nr:PilZ domain-containing protein [Planctomycetota bacterium]